MKHTVVVVDDHNLLSQAIGNLVEGFDDFTLLYTCKNGEELLTKFKNPKNIPQIVLMDVNMPILNGIETTEIIKEKFPDVKVLALSIEEEESTILKMLRVGARGYLMKDVKQSELNKALIEVKENGYYHTNTVAKLLINSLSEKENKKLELKERELEFIKYACSEMTYKEIADKMCLSPRTIEGYRDTLFEKLNLRNRTGLVIYAIKNKIFVP
ncbi:response regulator transcription factor [Patiriisocius hiemis]|uniref:Response regulator transcription factor n=1 Tax=Patiriisocius hiemis TaxID=3075604 RepID=A0ABU2YEC9_9FLAO|nr:response regulator transcription factor [Constantimarinum sp. W242]MDT0556549.1 response regulator transcription factor [Constantimarinum sp. W242]